MLADTVITVERGAVTVALRQFFIERIVGKFYPVFFPSASLYHGVYENIFGLFGRFESQYMILAEQFESAVIDRGAGKLLNDLFIQHNRFLFSLEWTVYVVKFYRSLTISNYFIIKDKADVVYIRKNVRKIYFHRQRAGVRRFGFVVSVVDCRPALLRIFAG